MSDKWQNRLVLEGVCSLLRATTGHMPGRPALAHILAGALAHSLKGKIYLHIWTAPRFSECVPMCYFM